MLEFELIQNDGILLLITLTKTKLKRKKNRSTHQNRKSLHMLLAKTLCLRSTKHGKRLFSLLHRISLGLSYVEEKFGGLPKNSFYIHFNNFGVRNHVILAYRSRNDYKMILYKIFKIESGGQYILCICLFLNTSIPSDPMWSSG